jgi:hypothetical protein
MRFRLASLASCFHYPRNCTLVGGGDPETAPDGAKPPEREPHAGKPHKKIYIHHASFSRWCNTFLDLTKTRGTQDDVKPGVG